METQTLEQHFVRIKLKQERKQRADTSPLPNLNVFAEQMDRAKTATIDSVREDLPKLVTVPYGKSEFFPEYENPPKYADWVQMNAMGFTSQPIQGFRKRCIPVPKGVYMTFQADKDLVEFRPDKNKVFGQVLRFKGNHFLSESKPEELWAFTHRDIEKLKEDERARWDYRSRAQFHRDIYHVGMAKDLQRPLTQEELEKLAKPLLVEHVFGIRPPTEHEIIAELLKVHKVRRVKPSDFSIAWIGPSELRHPLTKGILSLFADAKESGLFERLEFGLLKMPDPVLAGTYQGFRIPLAYWA